MNDRQRTEGTGSIYDSLGPLVLKVLEAMADPSNLGSDDRGQFCPYCNPCLDDYYEFTLNESDYPHEADCPVLYARLVLSANGRVQPEETKTGD